MRLKNSIFFSASILASALIFVSCTLSHNKIEQTKKQSYIDANLFFQSVIRKNGLLLWCQSIRPTTLLMPIIQSSGMLKRMTTMMGV